MKENNREKLSSVGLPASDGTSDGTSDALVNWVQTVLTLLSVHTRLTLSTHSIPMRSEQMLTRNGYFSSSQSSDRV